jgi:aminodeoxyfutalosine deaminase
MTRYVDLLTPSQVPAGDPSLAARGQSRPLANFVRSLPKTELHVHLEGSIQAETLLDLARRNGRLQEQTESWIQEHLARRFRYGSLAAFLRAFKLVTVLLESPADYALATQRMIEGFAAQRIRYAEVTLSAGVILWKKQSIEAVFETVRAASKEAEAQNGVVVQWIFDAIRHFGTEHAKEVLAWAAKFRDNGVVAFGIGGDEERGPAELFPEVYREAKDRGLHRTAHAGETGGAASVAQAVELLEAERIGHGIAAASDPNVMALLRERMTTIEACPTSNVATGLLPSVEAHPLPRFLKAGVHTTINSDDPALFGSTLEDELILCADSFGLSESQIVELLKNSIHASFTSDAYKQSLIAELEKAAAEPRVAEASTGGRRRSLNEKTE